MKDEEDRIRDRNPLIQSGYQGTTGSGSNALAGAQPSLTEGDIQRLRRSLDEINLDFESYTELLSGLNTFLTPDGYLDFDLIGSSGLSAGPVVAASTVQATIDTFVAGSGTGTATLSGGGSVSYVNGIPTTLIVGDVVLMTESGGTYVVIAIVSRSTSYIPPTYTNTPVSGFPVDGLSIGNGIGFRHTVTGDYLTAVAFDASGQLGLGTNLFVGLRAQLSTGTDYYEAIAYNGDTGTVTSLSWPFAATSTTTDRWKFVIANGQLHVKGFSTSSYSPRNAYVWDVATGWTTVSSSHQAGRMSSMEVAGQEYVIYSTSTDWYYIDPSTLTETYGGPCTGYVVAKGGYMWTSQGYRATASLTPTWTLVAPAMSIDIDMALDRVDVDSSTGDLVRFDRFGSPTRYGLEKYAFSNGAATQYAGVFTATGAILDGEPEQVHGVSADNGVYVAFASIDVEYYGGSNSTSDSCPQIFVTDGTTTVRVFEDFSSVVEDAYVGGVFDGTHLAVNYGIRTATTSNHTSTVDVIVV